MGRKTLAKKQEKLIKDKKGQEKKDIFGPKFGLDADEFDKSAQFEIEDEERA